MKMTQEHYQAIVEDLKLEYGDFTQPENYDNLLKMLEERFHPVATNYLSTCDIEADKIYLWISSENWGSPTLRHIKSMKFLHGFGFEFAHEYEWEDDELDWDDAEEWERTQAWIERGREFYGTEPYPTLSDFAQFWHGFDVTCNSKGAKQLGDVIRKNTGWYPPVGSCPLTVVMRFYDFFSNQIYARQIPVLQSVERVPVLYDDYGDVKWNGWSSPVFVYELLSKRRQPSLNYPFGITLK